MLVLIFEFFVAALTWNCTVKVGKPQPNLAERPAAAVRRASCFWNLRDSGSHFQSQ